MRVCEFLRGCLVICRRLKGVERRIVKCENLDDCQRVKLFVVLAMWSGFNDDPDAKGTETVKAYIPMDPAIKIQ